MTRRVAVLGDHLDPVIAALEAVGFELAGRAAPDLIFCHGGDGTLLRAERMFPGVPKVPGRVGARSRLCPEHRLPAILDRLSRDALPVEVLPKLELRVGAFRAWAVNDVVMHNGNSAVAVRYRVTVRGETSEEISGDGLVVATPFGSTAYYRSITAGTFTSGLGVAFNNATVPREPLVVADDEVIGVELVRGPAILVCDNDPRGIPMRASQFFDVGMSSEQATVLGLDALRCQRCRRDDGDPFNAH
jgi:NAD+ kinase